MIVLTAGGFIAALLPTGVTWAGCIQAPSDPSQFSILVNAPSSCAALSSNMSGCQVDATGGCTITKGSETITVKLTQGSVGGTTPVSWQVTNSTTANPKAGTVDISIAVGANGGSSCGWVYTPGSSHGDGTAFLKMNGDIQKIGAVFFCSDFLAPPAAVPRLSVNKTVMVKGGTCGVNDVDLLDVKTGAEVEYCYVVENLGNGNANALVLVDDHATPGDTSDDFDQSDIILTGLNGGVLAAGGKATGKSPAVLITTAGKLVNTVTVDGNSVDNPSYNVPSASDTATVNAEQALVTCPADFQNAVNQLSSQTDNFTYAVLHNPKKPEDVSVCVPTNQDSSQVRVRGVDCIDECVLKPGCDQTPLPAGCAPQVCQSSEAWTTHDENGACIDKATDTGGKLPYCWEVEQDLNQDCTLNETEPMKTHEVTTKQIHANPYVYQSCTTSGGRKVCTTYCYLYPGETSSVCPSGSIVK